MKGQLKKGYQHFSLTLFDSYFYMNSNSFVLFMWNILHNPEINCLKKMGATLIVLREERG